MAREIPEKLQELYNKDPVVFAGLHAYLHGTSELEEVLYEIIIAQTQSCR